jgi:DNA-binding response OmpR family regulator
MKKLILIIEDDEIFRSIIFDLLELENFNVISAQDGFLGLKLAKQFNPDLILCDINIPHLNGYEVLNKLREDLTIANTPFIFITCDTDTKSRYQAMQLGANDYLTKPVRISTLLESIAHQFKQLHSV